MKISIITKGYYRVLINNIQYSQHTQQQKAIETATNLALEGKQGIVIKFPDEITFSTDIVIADTTNPNNPELINIQII